MSVQIAMENKGKNKMWALAHFLAEYITNKGFIDGEYYTAEEWVDEISQAIIEGMEVYEAAGHCEIICEPND